MIGTIRDIWRKRTIVAYLVSTLLTSSYRTKAFGFLWALLDPLLFMGVYYLVFGKIVANRPPSFMLHLFIGVIAFRFLNTASAQGAGILRGQGGLIREVSFPKAALPVAIVLARCFDFAAGWLIAIPLAFIFGYPPHWLWLVLPLVIVIQVLFVTGFTLITTYVGLFFADIQNILNVGLRLWFYMSPVLYPLSLVESKTAGRPELLRLYMLNPMVNILKGYHTPVLERAWPGLGELGYALGFSVALVLVGIFIFSRAEGQIAKYV